MSESPILGVNIWVTLGPLAIACLLQQLLLGVILGQSFQYYAHSFVGDSFLNRFFITSLLILNLLIGGIDMSVIYYIVAKHFGDPSYIDFQTSPMWIEPALTAIVGFIAHSFSLLRYWHLTKFRAIVLILIFLATVSVGSGLAVSGSFIVERCFSSFPRCSTSIILWLVSTCITDLTMSGVLIVHLRSKATTKKIGTVINHLILISIETSGFTAGLALVNLLLFLLMQDSYFHLLAQFSISRAYTINVLRSLSMRSRLCEVLVNTDHLPVSGEPRGNRIDAACNEDSAAVNLEPLTPA